MVSSLPDFHSALIYVAVAAGTKENELRDGLAQKNRIGSISGPSKFGTTILFDRVLATKKV